MHLTAHSIKPTLRIEFNLYDSVNLTLNTDYIPVIHTGVGDSDIVICYEEIVIIFEAKLMNKQAQKRGKRKLIYRHLSLKPLIC